MKAIEITQQEIRMATRPNVYRNKKKYTRKDKHKNPRVNFFSKFIFAVGFFPTRGFRIFVLVPLSFRHFWAHKKDPRVRAFGGRVASYEAIVSANANSF